MKKTLIALAVAASAVVSGSAMADTGFSANNLDNTVTFSGTVTPTEVKNNWQWAVGQGFDHFDAETKQLSNSGQTLTISAKTNMPILVGKTTAAFTGGPGVSPQIAFSDSESTVVPAWSDAGGGTITLAVQDDGGKHIGTATLNVFGVGVLAKAKATGGTSISVARSPGDSGSFKGAVGLFGYDPVKGDIDGTLSWFGAPSIDALEELVIAYNGMSSLKKQDDSTLIFKSGDSYNSFDTVYAGAYALGVKTGALIKVDFDEAVTTETKWKAPLQMVVSYT